MGRYAIRRTLFAIPTLIAISLILFAIVDLAPGDPTGQLPLTIPAEVREAIRESLGLKRSLHAQMAQLDATDVHQRTTSPHGRTLQCLHRRL